MRMKIVMYVSRLAGMISGFCMVVVVVHGNVRLRILVLSATLVKAQ
jgi:hypothetical protein